MICIEYDLSFVTLWPVVGSVLRCIVFRLNEKPLLKFRWIHELSQDPIVDCVAPASDAGGILYQSTFVETTFYTLDEPQAEYQQYKQSQHDAH
jgi:hypothetical protein